MTDRVHSLTVVLAEDMRSDDVGALTRAIAQFRNVVSVSGHVSDVASHMAESRAKQKLSDELWKTLLSFQGEDEEMTSMTNTKRASRKQLMDEHSLTMADLIASVNRELKMRKNDYPRWVEQGRMEQEQADHEIACMAALLGKLIMEDSENFNLSR